MEVMESEAAITAINALQRRVKELEQEQQELKEEVYTLNMQLQMKDDHFLQRQEELIKATRRARDMINNTTTTMQQLKSERMKNEDLKTQIALTEATLNGTQVAREDSLIVRVDELKRIQKNVDAYETLLVDIFANPWQSIAANYLSTSEMRSIKNDPDLLPQPVRDIVQRINKLPKKYKGQDLVTRRTIIQGLICCLEAAGELSAKIHDFEKRQKQTKTPMRVGIEIHNVAVQLYVLTQAINRFKYQ